jgi:hypothetical protein
MFHWAGIMYTRIAMRRCIFATSLLTPLIWAQQPAIPNDTNFYTSTPQLQARVERFTAQPATSKAGQAVRLEWVVENPVGVSIEPGIGAVQARGSKMVNLRRTTTYVLTVQGPRSQMLTQEVTVTIPGTAALKRAASVKREIPRMPDGKPNLSGVYNMIFPGSFFPGGAPMNISNTPGSLETTPVLKPGAEKFRVVRGPDDAGSSADCHPPGVPSAMFSPYQWQIVQGLDQVVILYEYPGAFRVIPTHGGPHQSELDPTWYGDSIGHWEGDTLVVDTVGFNDKTELPGGYRHTESLHVVERFHRVTYDHLDYQATIEDPEVFEKPWMVHRTLPLRTDLDRVDEFICENNRDYSGLFKPRQ